MPLDPNAPTSDIGQMYRDYLQSKGAPLTQDNLQRAIAQSQREPGMIAGLSVQQPGGMHADAPPNVASASPNSSGAPAPTPNAVPLNMPQALPTPLQPPASPPPSMAAQGGQPTPTQGDALASNTPPPGQAPGSSQIANIINMALPLLATAGAGGALWNANRAPMPQGPMPQAAPAPATVGPRAIGRQITGADIVGPEVQGPPRFPPVTAQSNPATAPIGNIVAEKQAAPSAAKEIEGSSTPADKRFAEGSDPMQREPHNPQIGEGADPLQRSLAKAIETPAPVGSEFNYPDVKMPSRAPRVRAPRVRVP